MENNLEQAKIDAFLEQIIDEDFADYDSVFRALAHSDTIPIGEISFAKNEEIEHFIRKNFDQYSEVFKKLA
jgi:hypothetical protein